MCLGSAIPNCGTGRGAARRGAGRGLGCFFGLLIPLAQIPLTTAAVVLRANLPAAAASTLITNPVTFAPLYYTAYHLGAWVTGEAAIPSEDAEMRGTPEENQTVLQGIKALGKPLLVGLSIMACLAGVTSFVLIDLLWRWRTRARWRRRSNSG